MPSKKFYVVLEGRKKGIFTSWDECKKNVDGFQRAKYKSFPTQAEAELAFANGFEFTPKNKPLANKIDKNIIHQLQDGICVDGAWNTKTLDIEYQGVMLKSGETVFREGPFTNGTNNIAEFLGIVRALEWCKKYNKRYVIYSDSQTAIKWVKSKETKTTIKKNYSNLEIFSLLENALEVLKRETFTNPILKWQTQLWGENPADFGRK